MIEKQLMVNILLVGVGGFIGATSRYGVSHLFRNGSFPYGTLIVNIIGSFALGLLLFSNSSMVSFGDNAKVFLGIGIIGSFTTMSTFSVETFSLIENNEHFKSFMNVFFNLGGCVLGVFLARLAVIVFK